MPISFDPAELSRSMRREVMRAVVKSTEMVRSEAVRLVLQTSKSGRVYRRRGRPHQASAPGEPWASDTGHALSTIRTSYDEVALTGTVSITADYGGFLELGTPKMEPRPVLRPALENVREQIEPIIEDAVNVALTKK